MRSFACIRLLIHIPTLSSTLFLKGLAQGDPKYSNIRNTLYPPHQGYEWCSNKSFWELLRGSAW